MLAISFGDRRGFGRRPCETDVVIAAVAPELSRQQVRVRVCDQQDDRVHRFDMFHLVTGWWWRVGLYAGFCSGPCGPVTAIPLGRRLPAGSSGLPEGRTGGQPIPSARPCSGWGLPSRPGHPRRWCALTAPFHPYLCGLDEPPSAVCSLWHFPAGRPDWVLPSTLPCGVRTFLGRVTLRARTRPPGRLATATIVTCGRGADVRPISRFHGTRRVGGRPCDPARRRGRS